MAPNQFKQITQADADFFLANGWLKIPGCFTREAAEKITATVWTRLGMSPTDKSTWHTERINMPSHSTYSAAEFAPKAWEAICDLVGGEDRVALHNRNWNDGWIVNLGTPEGDGKNITGNELTGWHVDGDFFVHYLDSPEQGLLVIPLFTDIRPGGGGTMICPKAIKNIAKHLHDHPEGVSPRMTSRHANPTFEPEPNLKFYNDLASTFAPSDFVEATGSVGDVYLLHPLMLHSASNNMNREVRIITNPPVSLNEPFVFNRKNEDEFSVVEKKTLRELGVDSLDDGWEIKGTRDAVVPERIRRQNQMKADELRRLEELNKKAKVSVSEVGTLDNFT